MNIRAHFGSGVLTLPVNFSLIGDMHDRLTETAEFAAKVGAIDSFLSALDKLAYPPQDEMKERQALVKVSLVCDRTPHSYIFTQRFSETNVVTGGLLYSGPGVSLASQFTTSVEPESGKHQWSIHT